MVKILFLFLLLSFNANACVVLLYHHFDTETPKSTSISPKLFEQHLQYLQDHDFAVLSVKDLLKKLKNQEKLPHKCATLTTDDAYTSIATNAYPLLKKFNYPMSVFVATKGIKDKYKALLTYKKMQEMIDLIGFYNHSHEHQYFSKLSKKQAQESVLTAQKLLTKNLGVKEKIFAYPYGEYSLENYNLLKNMGYSSFGQHSGAIDLTSDIHYLPRFPMTDLYGKMASFKVKVNSLAMPILSQKPLHSISKNNPPTWELDFAKKLNLNCFVSNNEAVITWHKNTAKITAKNTLKKGRTKYNCTARSDQKGRFYWLSKQWIVQ